MWIEKYKPKTLDNLIGHYKAIRLLDEWYSKFKDKKDSRNIIVISGDSGIGKTLLIDLFLKKYKFNKTSINSNEVINKLKYNLLKHLEYKNILEILENKKIALVVDELDIFKEKTYVNDLIKMILKHNKNKVVFLITKTLNKTVLNNKKILLLELNVPSFNDVNIYINNILRKEKFLIEYKVLKNIYDKLSGDIRGIIILIYEMYMNDDKYIEKNLLLKKYFRLWKFKDNKIKLIYSKKSIIKKLDINSKIQDVNYKYFDILNKFIYEKIKTEDINTILWDSSFVPLTLYDNFNLLKPHFNHYTKCMKEFNYANYFNDKTFQSTYNFTEYNLIYMTSYFNYYITLNKPSTYKLKHSILLNKLNKIKLNNKLNNIIYTQLPHTNNILFELHNVSNKIDKKNKNELKNTELKTLFGDKVDYNKFIKLYS